jgi:hypothetical protein
MTRDQKNIIRITSFIIGGILIILGLIFYGKIDDYRVSAEMNNYYYTFSSVSFILGIAVIAAGEFVHKIED